MCLCQPFKYIKKQDGLVSYEDFARALSVRLAAHTTLSSASDAALLSPSLGVTDKLRSMQIADLATLKQLDKKDSQV